MFYKDVNTESREDMIQFLTAHPRHRIAGYDSTYSNDVKIYNLGLSNDQEDKLLDIMQYEEAYAPIQDLIEDFAADHDYRWQVEFSGRNNGHLILLSGGEKESKFKSFCTCCGQKSFCTVEESGNNVCGLCRQPARVNYKKPLMEAYTSYAAIDQDRDFEFWEDDELRMRVKLVQEFDTFCDDIRNEAEWIADHAVVKEKLVYEPRKIKWVEWDEE